MRNIRRCIFCQFSYDRDAPFPEFVNASRANREDAAVRCRDPDSVNGRRPDVRTANKTSRVRHNPSDKAFLIMPAEFALRQNDKGIKFKGRSRRDGHFAVAVVCRYLLHGCPFQQALTVRRPIWSGRIIRKTRRTGFSSGGSGTGQGRKSPRTRRARSRFSIFNKSSGSSNSETRADVAGFVLIS